MTLLDTLEIAARVFVALLLGGTIGLERQWRSRLAGVRTNALVSGGSALFVVVGSLQIGNSLTADPTRVAAQVVSGIGFLGAGVILRDGLNIRGLNTAATLWCAAAVGSLAGAGWYGIAAVGAIAVVATNTLLRPLSRMVTRRTVATEAPDVRSSTEYLLEVRGESENEQWIRALVLQATNRPGVSVRSVGITQKKNSQVAVSAEVLTEAGAVDSLALDRALHHIGLDPKVTSVRWWDASETD